MKTEFINVAAHELRTPIQPIIGLGEALRSKNRLKAEEYEEYLDVIIRNAKRLQQLADDILDRLFSKFASKSFQGTGLGLFISKSIIEAHGGKIWAENNSDGRGATFSFSLPVANNKTDSVKIV